VFVTDNASVSLPDDIPTTPVAASVPSGFGVYRLPSLPGDICRSLNSADCKISTCRRDRARIMQVLYDDLRARVGL